MTEHVLDDLELYAAWALEPHDADRVAAHLATCPECRAAAAELAQLVSVLSDALPVREPGPALRDRILATARAEAAPRREIAWSFRPTRRWLVGALAAAVLFLLALDLNDLRVMNEEAAERAQYEQQLRANGRSWYMAGKDDFTGSGGTLKVLSDGTATVLFHDLKPIEPNAKLAVWLVSPDGRWIRAADFVPTGQKLQTVELQALAAGYDRCAVTLETVPGQRGRTVMESRIAPN